MTAHLRVAFDADKRGHVARIRCVSCKAVWHVADAEPARCEGSRGAS